MNAVENAEVTEIIRAVFRALTRLKSCRDEGIRHDCPIWNADHQREQRDFPTRNRVTRVQDTLSSSTQANIEIDSLLVSIDSLVVESTVRGIEVVGSVNTGAPVRGRVKADGQTYSLFRERSSVALQASTDLVELQVVTMVRRLAAQEHSAARSTGVAHLCNHEVWCWC